MKSVLDYCRTNRGDDEENSVRTVCVCHAQSSVYADGKDNVPRLLTTCKAKLEINALAKLRTPVNAKHDRTHVCLSVIRSQ